MSELFGTSGVRGIVNKNMTPKLALNLSKSLATKLKGPGKILIGRDTRLSGEMIEDALVAGFLSAGCEVRKLGVVPTPVVGFSVSELEADAGVMITASHNPPEYNGIKFFDSRGMALAPEKEDELEEIYSEKDFRTATWSEIRGVKHSKVLRNYLDRMGKEVSLDEEYKVVIDCSNGPTSKTTPQLLEKLGCEVLTINSQLDGSFPGHPPEPVAENLQELGNFVEDSGADIGFAHDGDGDRIAAVDEQGRIIKGDKLLALIGSYSVKRFGDGMVTTVDASKIVDEQVLEAGGKVSKTKVGDVSVAQEMDSQNLVFGGEPTGTWIIGDVHKCPDGTLAAARILEMLDGRKEPLSQLVDSMPSYPLLREKIKCPDERKSAKMESVKDQAPSTFEEAEDMLTVDGVRLEFEGGDWILIRPSGTEPYIRITAEAGDRGRVESLVETAKQLLKQ